MKEWALEHPFLTYVLVGAAIDGAVALVSAVASVITKNIPEKNKEKEEDQE